ncbi:DUF4097 family beta strand repeat-containing protein [Streptomyces sp. NPDC059443]|uniref:DUF4097 family beta strand repeat-containing protein n=1 Tax=unclassified Streptomyces TaxID=2593676 RepID=UPI0036B7FB31
MTLTVRTAAASTAVALAAGLLLTGCSLSIGPQKSASSDATVSEAVTAVAVPDARSGDIKVTVGSGPGVVVHRTVHYRGDTKPEPAQQVSGGVLTLTNGDCSNQCSVDYRLEVPASAKVELHSDSGDITVTGVAAAGLESSSGEVKADGIAGPLKIRTSSGEITAGNLSGQAVEARSDSGAVTLAFAKAPASVAVESTSGSAKLKVPSAPYRVDVSTDSGARKITIPTDPSAPSHLSAKTTSGDIQISAA